MRGSQSEARPRRWEGRRPGAVPRREDVQQCATPCCSRRSRRSANLFPPSSQNDPLRKRRRRRRRKRSQGWRRWRRRRQRRRRRDSSPFSSGALSRRAGSTGAHPTCRARGSSRDERAHVGRARSTPRARARSILLLVAVPDRHLADATLMTLRAKVTDLRSALRAGGGRERLVLRVSRQRQAIAHGRGGDAGRARAREGIPAPPQLLGVGPRRDRPSTYPCMRHP